MEGAAAQYNWSGVIDFLIGQCRQSSVKEAEWELAKKELEDKVAQLEASLHAQEGLNSDLVKRVKMLEFSLKRERMKFMAYLTKSNHEEREQILAELKKSDTENLPQRVEDEAGLQRPDLELSKRRAKRQRNFLEKVLKEFDCTDILEEIKRQDDEGYFDKKNSNLELENELMSSPMNNPGKAKYNVFGGDKPPKHSLEDTEGIEPIFRIKVHSEELKCLSLAEEGKRLVSCGEDGKVCLMNIENLLTRSPDNIILSSSTEDSLGAHSVTARGNICFSGGGDGKVKLWELGKGISIGDSVDLHKDVVNNVRVHSKENLLLTTSIDGTIRCLKYKPGAFVDKATTPNFVLGYSQTPKSLCWASEGKSQFGVGVFEENDLYMFDLKSPKPLTSIKLPQSKGKGVRQLQALPTEQGYLAASEDGCVYQIDSVSNRVVQKFQIGVDPISALSISNDGLNFLTGGADGVVKVWDRRKGKALAEVIAHRRKQNDAVSSLVYLKEQGCFVSGGADGELAGFRVAGLY
jgi:WD40 repeat protein